MVVRSIISELLFVVCLC
ncbi:BnaA04g19680D [Brassica napus]|uniref:BnaA04g19680D protein n=1 Tax=Brassica napus TaxID=3708 RepID=A0A078HH86_BRANA|nr:BnaA04g19680D [Brassica napus]